MFCMCLFEKERDIIIDCVKGLIKRFYFVTIIIFII